MSTTDARIWAMVEQAARDCTDDDGRFNNAKFQEKLRERLTLDDELTPIERQLTIDLAVRSLTSRFVRNRNPKRQKSGTLFNPDYVIPLGNNERVWMEQATAEDLLTWAGLSTANLSRVAIAEGHRQSYAAERLAKFKDHPDWRLGRIERELFGWAESEADQYSDDDLGDEDGVNA